MRSWSIEQAASLPDLERCGYFGSYARGNWGVGSDLDLVAVVDDSREPFERRSLDWELNSLPVPADILIYTEAEWKELLGRNDKFSRVMAKEVVWTYIRNS